MIPAAILVIILLLGVGFLGPREERLARRAAGMDPREYALAFGPIKRVTLILVVLVVVATFLMTAHVSA